MHLRKMILVICRSPDRVNAGPGFVLASGVVRRHTLHIRLDPASAPRRSKALAALCTELTDTQTRYPGTELTLTYSIKDQPTHA